MKKRISAILWFSVFAVLCATLWITDKYVFQYIEQQQTFFADAGYFEYLFKQVGGFSIVLTNLLVQFFVFPAGGIIITAFLLTLSAYLASSIFSRLTHRKEANILAVLPAIGYIVQICDMNYHYFGLTAYILMLIALFVYVRLKQGSRRFIIGAFLSGILFLAAGPISMLFSISALLIEIFRKPKTSYSALAMPVVSLAFALIALKGGWAAEWRHVISPLGYYTLRLLIPMTGYISWGFWLASLLFVCLIGLIKSENKYLKIIITSIEIIAIICLGFISYTGMMNKADKFFRELFVRAEKQDWDGIIRRCSEGNTSNLLFQNYLGIALAEKGQLATRAFEFPIRSIRGLYVETNKTPYVSALLSDVFYSMGEIGLAQRYAFESNEAFGNYSPRALKRLVQTNLEYESYEVADKYISLLKKTLFYKHWAEDITSDPHITAKKACIFPENKLSGLGGLEIDFTRIIRANPTHQATPQYLGTLFLLLKDIESFIRFIDEFYGTEVFPESLPLLYQQAVCLYSNGDQAILDKYNIQKEVIDGFQSFTENPKDWKKSYWFFYFYYQE